MPWLAASILALGVVACGGEGQSSSGATTSNAGGAGGSGDAGGAGGASPSACEPDVSGNAKPVTIRLRNTGAAELQVGDSECITQWRVTAPSGAEAPKGFATPVCQEVPSFCPMDCLDSAYKPLPPQGEVTFTWNGVVFEDVDAMKAGCPAAQASDVCPTMCARAVDAAPGSYTLKAYAYDGMTPITKTVTFMYPDMTEVEAVFP